MNKYIKDRDCGLGKTKGKITFSCNKHILSFLMYLRNTENIVEIDQQLHFIMKADARLRPFWGDHMFNRLS